MRRHVRGRCYRLCMHVTETCMHTPPDNANVTSIRGRVPPSAPYPLWIIKGPYGAVVCRFVHGRQPAEGEELKPGDLEAALLAGLGKIKRNQAARQMVTKGRPVPTGYTVGEVEGRLTVTAAPPEQGGHLWHGRRVVELIAEAHGNAGLQVRSCWAP